MRIGVPLIALVRRRAARVRATCEARDIVPLARVLTLIVFLRYIVMPTVAFLANVTFPPDKPPSFTVFNGTHHFWDMFARYDSGWYYTVARDGYRYTSGEPCNLAYFPLYPLLMGYVGWLAGGEQHHYYFAGMLISRAAFLAALVMLFYLARLDVDVEAAQRTVLYIAVFPFAFFYSRVYAESLFLLLTVAAFYFFRTRRWELGGAAGGLASATRANGILSLAAYGWLGWQQCAGFRSQRLRATLAIVMSAAGLVLFSAYAYRIAGSPLAWLDAMHSWNYAPGGGAPWVPLIALARQLVRRPYEFLAFEPNGPYDALNGVTAAVFVAAIPLVWARLGAAYGIHMVANLWVPLSSGHFEGLGRYCAVLFPFFIWLGSFKPALVRDMILVGSIPLYVLCVSLFIKLHPIF